VDAAEEYRKKVREAMARQKDSMGYSCRLCGMIFPEGMPPPLPDLISAGAEVDVPSSLHPSRKSVAHKAENEKQDGGCCHIASSHPSPPPCSCSAYEGTKKIPCHGYRVTDRMAYALAGLPFVSLLLLTALPQRSIATAGCGSLPTPARCSWRRRSTRRWG
jgi:hypothetical protein